jgi:hypothetical protein
MMRPVLLLACAIALFLAILWQLQQPGAVSTPRTSDEGDGALFQAIVLDLQHGQDYYNAVGTELRSRDYATSHKFRS